MSNNRIDVTFDSNSFIAINGLSVLSTNQYNAPRRSINSQYLVRSDKNTHPTAFWTERNIVIKVGISRATRDLLETSLDAFYKIIQGKEKTLRIPQSNGYRDYTATLADVNPTVEGGSYYEADVIFTCSDNLGMDTAYTLAVSYASITGTPATYAMSIDGSAEWQYPLITFTFTSVTGGTTASVSLGNATNGQSMVIQRDWVSGDVLVVDVYAGTCKVNGLEVAFTGAMPKFCPGAAYLDYADTFTARNYSGNVRYKKRWL